MSVARVDRRIIRLHTGFTDFSGATCPKVPASRNGNAIPRKCSSSFDVSCRSTPHHGTSGGGTAHSLWFRSFDGIPHHQHSPHGSRRGDRRLAAHREDRKSTRLNSSH